MRESVQTGNIKQGAAEPPSQKKRIVLALFAGSKQNRISLQLKDRDLYFLRTLFSVFFLSPHICTHYSAPLFTIKVQLLGQHCDQLYGWTTVARRKC